MIVISYGSAALRDCCASTLTAEQELGQAHAAAVLGLIADAEALETAADLLQFYGESATVETDSLLIAVGAKCAVRFVTVGTRVIRDNSGRICWNSVQRLKLVAIVRC